MGQFGSFSKIARRLWNDTSKFNKYKVAALRVEIIL